MHNNTSKHRIAAIIKSLHRHQMTNDATAFRNHADIIPRFLSFVNIFRKILALAGAPMREYRCGLFRGSLRQ